MGACVGGVHVSSGERVVTSTTNPAENPQAVTRGHALAFARFAKRATDRHSRVPGRLAALAFISACV